MTAATIKDKLNREIQRMENHLDALYDILEGMDDIVSRNSPDGGGVSRVPLMKKALEKVRSGRSFSTREVTAFARRIEPDIDRRLIYNCLRGYLDTLAKKGELEKLGANEYRRTDMKRSAEEYDDE